MTDRKALHDPNETPEDVATLYSWANLHGAKYRDFSVSRAQTREKARQRVQEAMEEERERARRQADEQRAAEAARALESARQSELTTQAIARQAAEQAAQRAADQMAQQAAQRAAEQAAQQAAQQAEAARHAAQQAEAARQAAQQAEAARRAVWEPPLKERFAGPADSPYASQPPAYGVHSAAPAYRAATNPPQTAPIREESYPGFPDTRTPADVREGVGRPAWLMPERQERGGPAPAAQLPDDTLQGSRDRLASRWFALRGVFENTSLPAEAAPAPIPSRAPAVAVFSLAGGVGKTSLVATLGRALSARGERVLLVDTAAFGLLPFFFGARDQRPGVLRTFSPPAVSGDAPIQLVAIDPEDLGPETGGQEALVSEISKHARGVGRIIVDLATASGATTRRIMRLSPLVLVPMVPDMNSVVSVGSIDAFFEHNSGAAGKPLLPYYVLNQFDPALPLHLDVREVLREQLGDRLLSFAVRRAPAVSEALAEGMTVMDYAPNSSVAEDFAGLAGWVKSVSAPASTSFRGVRWSER